MKKIINKIKYDTDTAQLIGRRVETSEPPTREHTLYHDPITGKYYLTRISHTESPDWSTTTTDILPFPSREKAQAWAKTYLPVEILKQEFGDKIAIAEYQIRE